MEIVSQTAIKVIDNPRTLYMLPWLIIAAFGVVLYCRDYAYDDIRSLFTLIPIICFTMVVLFANRESMYRSIGKYEYTMQYVNNVPEIDHSKFTLLNEKDVPSKLSLVLRDNLTQDEEEGLKKTAIFEIIVIFYRGCCVALWFPYLIIFLVRTSEVISAFTKSFRESKFAAIVRVVGSIMVASLITAMILFIIVIFFYISSPLPV